MIVGFGLNPPIVLAMDKLPLIRNIGQLIAFRILYIVAKSPREYWCDILAIIVDVGTHFT